MGLLRVKAHGDDVQGILVGIVPGILQFQALAEQEFFVICQLEIEFDTELVLQVLGEYPGH